MRLKRGGSDGPKNAAMKNSTKAKTKSIVESISANFLEVWVGPFCRGGSVSARRSQDRIGAFGWNAFLLGDPRGNFFEAHGFGSYGFLVKSRGFP